MWYLKFFITKIYILKAKKEYKDCVITFVGFKKVYESIDRWTLFNVQQELDLIVKH